jgi:hypothetical protein
MINWKSHHQFPSLHRQLYMAAGTGHVYRWFTDRMFWISEGAPFFDRVETWDEKAGHSLSPFPPFFMDRDGGRWMTMWLEHHNRPIKEHGI